MAVTSLTRNSIVSPTKYTDFLAGNHQYDVSSMIPIQSVTMTGGASAIVNIPQIYQDLVISVQARDTRAGATWLYYFGFNDSAIAGQYSWTELTGNGTSATSSRSSAGQNQFAVNAITGAGATSGLFGSMNIHILNYRSSTNKTVLYRSAYDQNGSGGTTLGVGMWTNTAAISSIQLRTEYLAGSTVTLYGIKTVGQ